MLPTRGLSLSKPILRNTSYGLDKLDQRDGDLIPRPDLTRLDLGIAT